MLQADDSEIESVAAAHPTPPTIYTTKIAQMTRASTSVSSTPAVSTTSHSELQSLSSSDESSLVEYKENTEVVVAKVVSPKIVRRLMFINLQQEPTKLAAVVADDNSSLSRISEDSEKASSPSSPSTPIVETPKAKMTFDHDFGTVHKRKQF